MFFFLRLGFYLFKTNDIYVILKVFHRYFIYFIVETPIKARQSPNKWRQKKHCIPTRAVVLEGKKLELKTPKSYDRPSLFTIPKIYPNSDSYTPPLLLCKTLLQLTLVDSGKKFRPKLLSFLFLFLFQPTD